MTRNWISTQDSLPDRDRLVLVKGTHEGPALAIFNGDEWRVQPFHGAWYMDRTGIHEWIDIPSRYKEEDILQEEKVININFNCGRDCGLDSVTLKAFVENMIAAAFE